MLRDRRIIRCPDNKSYKAEGLFPYAFNAITDTKSLYTRCRKCPFSYCYSLFLIQLRCSIRVIIASHHHVKKERHRGPRTDYDHHRILPEEPAYTHFKHEDRLPIIPQAGLKACIITQTVKAAQSNDAACHDPRLTLVPPRNQGKYEDMEPRMRTVYHENAGDKHHEELTVQNQSTAISPCLLQRPITQSKYDDGKRLIQMYNVMSKFTYYTGVLLAIWTSRIARSITFEPYTSLKKSNKVPKNVRA